MGLWDSFIEQFRTPYELEDLLKSRAEVLGKGTYGTTYKASMDSGFAVSVKRFKNVGVSEEEFRAKVEEIGRLDHENLSPLRAFHANADERLLIYDYSSLGTLYSVIHERRATGLNWETRARIAYGIACGVEYIHSQGPTICHGNIKASNIILSKNYEARISDFGVSQLVMGSTAIFTPPTTSYHAPELSTSPADVSLQKADVYSFGMVLCDLIQGNATIKGKTVETVIRRVIEDEWNLDVEVVQYKKMEKEMVQVFQLAIECSGLKPAKRPTMADVRTRIEQICGFTSVKPQKQDGNFKGTSGLRELCLPSP